MFKLHFSEHVNEHVGLKIKIEFIPDFGTVVDKTISPQGPFSSFSGAFSCAITGATLPSAEEYKFLKKY